MARTKSRLPQTGNRLLVTRSCKYIFAQVIDIKTGKTLIGLSDRIFTAEKKEKMTKITSKSLESMIRILDTPILKG